MLDRKRRKLEGTDFQIIRLNLLKGKELATALSAIEEKEESLKIKELATALNAVNQARELIEDGC